MRIIQSVVATCVIVSGTVAFTSPPRATIPQSRSLPYYASSTDTDSAKEQDNVVSLQDRIASSSAASAAAVATAAVNAAVSMKSLEAPDIGKSYIAIDRSQASEVDSDGLPLVYDKDQIERYWTKERGALNQRWGTFVSKAVPFLSKMVTLFIKDGEIKESEIPALSRQARMDLEELGPTFIKAGQMFSVRPDVLPQSTLEELQLLQDSVVPFNTTIAIQQIETELGRPLGEVFSSLSEEPVAAASLAQVYKGVLRSTGEEVAVKVQRPSVLPIVSKDLYVLRRAAEVWQGLVERFAPQQKTNYVALLNEFAVGFYTELDFLNEMKNQVTLREDLIKYNVKGIIVPNVYEDLCTRRLLVSEWIDGQKLSKCEPDEIAEVIPIAQEAFLVQLFETGFFHGDPHPGNLLKLDKPTAEGHKIAIIDCGLMAAIDSQDRDNMISTVIHLANKDYAALVDDFVKLNVLPEDSDRAAIIPLMDKALTPYVKGGGAKKYAEELKNLYGMDETLNSQVGGFQAMTQDALTVLNDIPFSIPPYFAILGRAIITLEGIALSGNPDYGIIMESYPFIARKLLREDRPEIQSALQEVLFSRGRDGKADLKLSRLLVLLNNAAGSVATQDGAAFVDLDSVPEDGIDFSFGLKYVLSDNAESLRNLLEKELDTIVDILARQIFRKGATEAVVALTPPRPPVLPFLGDIFPASPKLDEIPLPFLLPGIGVDGSNNPSVSVMTLKEFIDLAAPKLDQQEDIYAISLAEAAREFFGDDIGEFVQGDGVLSVKSVELLIGFVRSGLLGGSDLLSSEAVTSAIDFVGSTLSSVRGNNVKPVEEEMTAAIASLSVSERERLDEIVTGITTRGLERALSRLSQR